jgi:hypothetical protein
MFCFVFRHKKSSGFSAAALVLLALLLWPVIQDQQEAALPQPLVMASIRPLAMQACAECHAKEVDEFRNAPHNQTLRTPLAVDVPKLSWNQTVRIGDVESVWSLPAADSSLWVNSTAYPSPIKVDWLFGSGSHAITPVSLNPDADGRTGLIEHHMSWYPEAGLAATLGITNSHPTVAGIKAVGECLHHPEAMECFGCHATHLTINDGQLIQSEIMPGVQCARCHVQTHEHVAAMQNGSEATFMDDWKRLSPLESSNRCGECHRRADQMTADELTPTNKLLIRFAPVGISQSACFLQQDTMHGALGANKPFNCTFCHDPHQPASRDASFYVNRCLECHGAEPGHASLCRSQPMTSQCLSCHMPTVEVQKHLRFTDHWIRIREDSQQATQKAQQ